jgi:CDP-diacylglycerol--serine O-phosphatidyltransferase
MNIKKHIPNLLTCGNLFCGCLAITSAFNGNLIGTAYLVGIAAVLDFFDGFVARLLKVGGELGKQLDSLADMVTFGVVPGVVMYHLLGHSWLEMYKDYQNCQTAESNWSSSIHSYYFYIQYIPFLITIFSCIRLAKFNVDTRQTNSFIGLPTPANTILICSIPMINEFQPNIIGFNLLTITQNVYFLIGITLIMSYLLVAEIPLFAMKFKNFGWPNNRIRYSFLIISLVLLILFHFIAIPFIIFLYILLSVISNRSSTTKTLEH